MTTPDLFAPAPLWAQECIACGHRQRYIDHGCAQCGSYRVKGRNRGDFEQHARECRAYEASKSSKGGR